MPRILRSLTSSLTVPIQSGWTAVRAWNVQRFTSILNNRSGCWPPAWFQPGGQETGRRLPPCVDVRLEGGYRVHAVLAPISTAGTLLSIRIRREEVFTLAELRERGMFSEHVESVLRAIMAHKLSFLISGATGSGKTTLLSTMLGLSHPAERLVLIEDAAELNPVHPHVVTLESRHGNLEEEGGPWTLETWSAKHYACGRTG